MTYSCALFEEGVETLEDAQRAKLELICGKLQLKPGMRMLDIGCGWGSLAIHAAREHGVSALGITLSPPQAELARERAEAAGVGDRVEVEVMDYRDLPEASFDAVASIGMVEHVGEGQIDEYAAQIARVLGPGGRVLNHGITYVPSSKSGAHIGGAFSDRYVFPDGELLNLSRMLQAFERAGFEALNVEDLHTDYAETLRHWTTRFEDHLEEAERLAGPERTRVWRLYLRAARNSFEVANNAVYQLLCSRPLTEGPSVKPTGRAPWSGSSEGSAGASTGVTPIPRSGTAPQPTPWRTTGTLTVDGQAGSHRLLGVELPRLAWSDLSRRASSAALARALRRALRHGRGEQHVLPAAVAVGGRGLGGTDPARVRNRREGEPLPDSRQAAARDEARGGQVLRGDQAARGLAEAGPCALAAAGELQARRRAPRRSSRTSFRRGATASSSATPAGSSRRYTSSCGATEPRS